MMKVDTVKDKLKNILIYGTAGAGSGAVGGVVGNELAKRKPITVDFDQLNTEQQIRYLETIQKILNGKFLLYQ